MLNVSVLKNVLEDFKSEMEDIKSTQRIIQECCSHSENVSVVPISNTDSLPVHAVSLSKPTSLENDLTTASYSEKASPLPLSNVAILSKGKEKLFLLLLFFHHFVIFFSLKQIFVSLRSA